jgi:hypothetical protein
MYRNFWIEIIVWEYGAWKTLNVMKELRHRDWFLTVGNMTSTYIDIQFQSVEDLVKILWQLKEVNTSCPEYKRRNVAIVIDEASIYFFARFFQKFPKEFLPFLVQLRKLNIMMYVIVQDVEMLDKTFRRLCFNVRKYYRWFFVDKVVDFKLHSWTIKEEDEIDALYTPIRVKSVLGWFWYNIIWWTIKYDSFELIWDYNILSKDFSLITFLKDRDERKLLEQETDKRILTRIKRILDPLISFFK